MMTLSHSAAPPALAPKENRPEGKQARRKTEITQKHHVMPLSGRYLYHPEGGVRDTFA
ncbi:MULTISPECIES: hypothetical protein [Kamptonema]|uniref:hypothetical protein n=1 Tax=Kamptonema TaxID=1501433 RepID=UPI0003024CA7|nr:MULTISPECIES: hypothetical protein [Kamptonema]